MSEASTSKRKLSGLFNKKNHKRKDEDSVPEKKRRHKKQNSSWEVEKVVVNSSRLDEHANNITAECDQNKSVENEKTQQSSHARAPNEKEKPRNLRRRLPFGKRKSKKKEELGLADDVQEALAEYQGLSDYEGERELEEEQGQEEASEMQQQAEEANEEGVFRDMFEDIGPTVAGDSPQDFLPLDVAEITNINPDDPNSCSESGVLIKMAPEVQQQGKSYLIPWSPVLCEILVPLKELVLNSDKRQAYEICVSTVDFGLAKLINLWSFVVNQAGEKSRQVVLYFISSLVKRYPHCFKVQIKKKKRRNNKAAPKEASIAQ